MSLLVLLPYYVRWYYGTAPKNIIAITQDTVWFLWRFFSLDLYASRYRSLAGFLVWLISAVCGLVAVVAAAILSAVAFVVWFLMPALLTIVFLLGILFIARS